MKKLILILILALMSVKYVEAKSIEVNYSDGIYHIILSGEKIKKKIKFVTSESLMTNKEA